MAREELDILRDRNKTSDEIINLLNAAKLVKIAAARLATSDVIQPER